MSTTTFIPHLQDNLDKILHNNKKDVIVLKYLFENIPLLIRNRLEKNDLKFIFGPNNYNNHLINFYNNENKSYRNKFFVGDEFSILKEDIKKLIVNDNKYVVKILNEYYEKMNEMNKGKLYKYKKRFIQEMKILNADILLS
jgi:glutathionyl-hydroquinone reductase